METNKYVDYCNTTEGINSYNRFKEIIYQTDSGRDKLTLEILSLLELENGTFNSERFRMLDLGCGDARRSIFLARNIQDLIKRKVDLVLVDSSQIAIHSLRNLVIENIEIKGSSANIYDFLESCKNKYDFVCLVHSIYTLQREELVRVFSNLEKIRNQNGKIIFVVNSPKSFVAKVNQICREYFFSEKTPRKMETKSFLEVVDSLAIQYSKHNIDIPLSIKSEEIHDILNWCSMGKYSRAENIDLFVSVLELTKNNCFEREIFVTL